MTPKDSFRIADEHQLPRDFGILIRLFPDGKVVVESVRDRHYPEIHPNVYAPEMTSVYRLQGGGSGAAVFHGKHSDMSFIVLKHGSASDTREVFSLVTICRELRRRGAKDEAAAAAAHFMSNKIPEVRSFIYTIPRSGISCFAACLILSELS